MYIYIYTYIYIYICTHICVYICSRTHIDVWPYTVEEISVVAVTDVHR